MNFNKLFGDKAALQESLLVALSMLAVTALYEYIMLLVIPDFAINWYEFTGTWFTLTAVWLVRTQNIQNWLWGIAGVILLGIFFSQIGLPGQQWLQWGYFLPVQIWSWYYWVGGMRGERELPVTTLTSTGHFIALVAVILGTVLVYLSIDFFAPQAQYPILDALVVAASVTAQFLMGRKKMESWVLWLGPVNLISIVLFYLAGAYVLTALYIAFFVHALFGVRSWYKASQLNEKAYDY